MFASSSTHRRWRGIACGLALFVVLAATESARATTVTINATYRGYYEINPDLYDPFVYTPGVDPDPALDPNNFNRVDTYYRVGYPAGGTISRNFFVFDIPADVAAQVGGPITSALIRFNTYSVASGGNQSLDYRLYLLTPTTVSQIANNTPNTANQVFADLGKGNPFAPSTSALSSSLPNQINPVSIPSQINANLLFEASASIADILLAAGGLIGYGGAIGPNDGFDGLGTENYAALTSAPPPNVFVPQLILRADGDPIDPPDPPDPVIPEPSGLVLWSLGAIGALGVLRRKKRRAAKTSDQA